MSYFGKFKNLRRNNMSQIDLSKRVKKTITEA